MTSFPEWARALDLTPHPEEGGWYRETWRSDIDLPGVALPNMYGGSRSAGTAILFLLEPGQQSAWHTVRGTEIWLYHRGSPLLLELAGDGDEPGSVTTHVLGPDISSGQSPQVVIPPRSWQRARPIEDEAGLVSCIVVPGFDFADFRVEGQEYPMPSPSQF
ncbi:cupin domain-containing protein [Rhodococcus xishaensis]|uniref:Cupin domain-containing protein n=1 Tax=Rhodococcus xishaensis TaxID=2487364 RepID=A0A438AWK4_9NOCA|nr:cupin domain-containing protein [Rhodococcus xishaensis]RVW03055.1 cupin domain-containing protein [Rhodococcus xishaensis]